MTRLERKINDSKADRFARELLMPEVSVRALIEEAKAHGLTVSVYDIVETFGVPADQAQIRLKELGYFLRQQK